MSLPIFKGGDTFFQLLQTGWSKVLNPVLKNPVSNGRILTSVSLANGANTVNHRLGRPLQGWYVVRQRAAATFYDTQDSNKTPALTLALQSSAAVTVDLYVF